LSFYDIYHRCKISATCRQWKSHDLKSVTGDDIVFESHNWNKTKLRRAYFKGTLTYCDRQGCYYEDHSKLAGPWKKTEVIVATGEEVEVGFAQAALDEKMEQMKPFTEDNGGGAA
jgi:hypothetical protein